MQKRTRTSTTQTGIATASASQRPFVGAPAGRDIHGCLSELVATTTDAMIALDQGFQVLCINPGATAMFGWAAEQAIGHSCKDVMRCRNLNRTGLCGTSSCPLTRVLQQKHPLPNEELIIGAEPGRSCEVSVSATPVDLDGELCVVFTARDVSALQVAHRVRANFVSMVSHELRTPLNSVHGFIELLLQGHMGDLTDEQRQYLGYAHDGVQQLISMVEDILFMTRSDLGQFEVKQQKAHWHILAKQLVSSLKLQARKAEVELKVDLATSVPLFYVDPRRMKQVLSNLVTNAIKFTPPGGTVTISAQPYNDRFVLISVADTGSGIPEEDRQHIFQRFYQSNHSEQSKVGGYGLGLSIAKLIVEQHGGTIWFDTVLEQGTTFYFTMPRYIEDEH